MSKIDVLPIIARHFETLRDHATGRRSKADMFIFFGVPLIVSGAALYYRITLTSDALNAVLASFSIFAGLLLNLLLLVYTRAGEDVKADIFAANVKRFVTQLSENIEFAVLVSVFVVISSLVATATLNRDPNVTPHAGLPVTVILVYLTTNFLLTLLMVLKRIHSMLLEKIERPSSSAMKKAS
ncbi:MAG TPA: hypothetical protein VNH65_07945 [Candidatus Acidoferrum sp.]|nr:hypothetical protein [Candidatus Acidoferrum sp.]